MRRLTTIPGVGAITAASIKALVPDPAGFKSGRHLAAWLGLTPKSRSSGGKERLGKISKMGNAELRSLLVLGATSVLRHARGNKTQSWHDDPIRSSPLRSPVRWRGSSGRF